MNLKKYVLSILSMLMGTLFSALVIVGSATLSIIFLGPGLFANVLLGNRRGH